MRWDKLTTNEFAGLDRSIPVIVNVAAIEQHGPHLAIDTDVAIGGHFLDRLDERLGDKVLILPQVKVCCSEHHMDFAGTLTVRHETFLAYVGDILESVVRHGFTNLVIFNSHGGNQAVGQVLLETFGSRHRECTIAMLTWWRLVAPELEAIRESGFAGVNHACEFETSLMLLAAPDNVRRELIGDMSYVETYDWANADMIRASRGALFRTMHQMSGGTGVVGDPSTASARKGELITDAVVNELERVVRSLTKAN
ncbi:creatininase family protein [Aminobacter aganoensis]|uniref:Creatinine amidohydrolase n=1 Tax=Aminobacter aganoensis TaxID=83264 RepID=A0A7X0KL88_9HYPH|nr:MULTISPECIES: creatininase family protein [Aminobacter]KQU76459.1 creatinine amidohydrolase [Aminobacter sp. DSM 101952]MBB6354811.1 creatinine amidohydrolase [Aminobacter aganoensis]